MMRHLFVALLAFLALTLRPLPGLQVETVGPWAIWSPSDCATQQGLKWRAAYHRRVLAAQPGDRSYTLHPMPRTSREAVEAMLDHLAQMPRRPGEISAKSERDRRAVALHLPLDWWGRVRWRVAREAEWNSWTRCGYPVSTRWCFLLQGFRIHDGHEVFRGAIDETGRPWIWENPGAQTLPPIEKPAVALAALERRLGHTLGPVRVQLVDTRDSSPLICDVLYPCLAAQTLGGTTYVIGSRAIAPHRNDGPWRIVKFTASSERRTPDELHANRSLVTKRPAGKTWLSIGGIWTLAEVVPPKKQ